MPSFQSHLLAGAVSGGAIDIIRKVKEKKPLDNSNILMVVGDVCLGAVGGVLPDKLEPAIHPMHRKFFHSMLFFGIIVVGVVLLWQIDKIPEWIKVAVTVIAGAFIIHLVLDSFTPAGLPIA